MVTLKSKTHKFGVFAASVGGIVAFLPTVREFIPDEMYGGLLIFFGIVSIVLRNVTTKPVEDL